MVYRSDCRYLPYSLHFSEFMLIFFTRKRKKHEKTRSVPFFVWYENGRRRLLGAQSINTERTSLRANGLASRRKPTQVFDLRSTCVSFGYPLAWTLVELQFVRKSTQAHASHLIYSLQDSWSGMNYIAVIGTLILVAFFQLGPGEKQGAIRWAGLYRPHPLRLMFIFNIPWNTSRNKR